MYVDFEILASTDDEDYLVLIGKSTLNALVKFNEELVVRSWDGLKPVVLEARSDSELGPKLGPDDLDVFKYIPKIRANRLKRLIDTNLR